MNNRDLKLQFIHSLRDKTHDILEELNQEFSEIPDFDFKWFELSVNQYNNSFRTIKELLLYFPEFNK